VIRLVTGMLRASDILVASQQLRRLASPAETREDSRPGTGTASSGSINGSSPRLAEPYVRSQTSITVIGPHHERQ
jgi:hypothetical protein